MSSKRTFGLVGDYGGDSSDENEDSSVVNENKDSPDQECLGYLVEKKPKIVGGEDPLDSGDTISSNALLRSKWEGVRTEYEDSSLMYKYTQVSFLYVILVSNICNLDFISHN